MSTLQRTNSHPIQFSPLQCGDSSVSFHLFIHSASVPANEISSPWQPTLKSLYLSRQSTSHANPCGATGTKQTGRRGGEGSRSGEGTTPDSWASAGRQISWKCFSLVNFACGKLTVWFHLSLMGEPVPITRLNCELHSSPQPSPQPFQRGPRENLSSVCVLPQQRGGCNQVAPCFS